MPVSLRPRHGFSLTPEGRFWLADDGVWFTAVQTATLSADEMTLPLRQRQRLLRERTVQATAVRLSFAGAELAGRLEPLGPVDTKISFLHGADPSGWKTDVPSWSGVRVKICTRASTWCWAQTWAASCRGGSRRNRAQTWTACGWWSAAQATWQ